MREIVCFVVITCALGLTRPLQVNPYNGPAPIAVLIQTDPWLMVIGSDLPMIVIYEDGQVIYLRREKNKGAGYVKKNLTKQELEIISKKLCSFGDYSAVKQYYNLAPNVTDMPEAKMYLNCSGRTMATTVYGLTVSDTQIPGSTTFPESAKKDPLPEALRKLHQYLTTLNFAEARPWQPQYIEVMIWPYEYAPDKSIHWPKDWPGLDSPSTFPRGGNSYSIFMPASDTPKLNAFLRTRREKGAVEIGGKKWAVAYRGIFPSEPVWSRVFRRNE